MSQGWLPAILNVVSVQCSGRQCEDQEIQSPHDQRCVWKDWFVSYIFAGPGREGEDLAGANREAFAIISCVGWQFDDNFLC